MVSFKQWVLNIILRRVEEPVVTHELPCEVLTDTNEERVNELVLRMNCKNMPIEVILNERTKELTVYTDSASYMDARLQLLAMAVDNHNRRRAAFAS